MNTIFYAPLSFVLIAFFIYFICKILACQQAFEKDPDPDENPVRRQNQPIRTPRPGLHENRSDSARIEPYTISGRSPQVIAAELESPPKYEMPPAYHEVVFAEKAPKCAVISIERG